MSFMFLISCLYVVIVPPHIRKSRSSRSKRSNRSKCSSSESSIRRGSLHRISSLIHKSAIPECLYRESRETGTGPPIKTLGGDVFGRSLPFIPNRTPIFKGAHEEHERKENLFEKPR